MPLLNRIDKFLNIITMYRLVLYGLSILAFISLILSLFNFIPYTPIQLVFTFVITFISCYLSNKLFAYIFRAATNYESFFITALILFFVIAPITNETDAIITAVAGLLAMGSKYLLAIYKKHLFNPVAISLVLIGLAGFGNAIWWVGSLNLLPFVAILGLLIVRKIRRFILILPFFVTAIITLLYFNLSNNISPFESVMQIFTSWPSVFFATIMLTEPLTSPPNQKLRIMYAGLVGILFGSQFSFGIIHSSPELSLVIGNIFSYLVSPKQKLFLQFKQKLELAPNIFEIIFSKKGNFAFKAGQYLEWTLPHNGVDTRGNRRYFTIASSPTEDEIKLGIKLFPSGSSFKQALVNLNETDQVIGSQLTGDFVLPSDTAKKLVFIAGGIGVTPFRSMTKYLLDKKEKRDIVFFYTCLNSTEFVYKNIFDQAEKELPFKPVYVLTGKEIPQTWKGEKGFLSKDMVQKYAPDFKERMFYLSGPVVMVDSYKKLLFSLGVLPTNIVTDYFPGF